MVTDRRQRQNQSVHTYLGNQSVSQSVSAFCARAHNTIRIKKTC